MDAIDHFVKIGDHIDPRSREEEGHRNQIEAIENMLFAIEITDGAKLAELTQKDPNNCSDSDKKTLQLYFELKAELAALKNR